MKPVSLADITYEEGLALLALRKQAIDYGKLAPLTAEEKTASYHLESYAEKRAEGWLDNLTKGLSDAGKNFVPAAKNTFNSLKGQYSQFAKNNPELNRILKTTGVGAGLGAATGLISSDKHRLRNMALGGLAGGAIGGGLGTAMSSDKLYDRYVQPTLDKSPNPTEADLKAFEAAERGRLSNPMPTAGELASGATIAGGAALKNRVHKSLAEELQAINPNQMTSNIMGELDNLKGSPADINAKLLRLFTDPSKPVDSKSLSRVVELMRQAGHKLPAGTNIDFAAELRMMPPAQREKLFKSIGMFDSSPGGTAAIKSRLTDLFGSGSEDVASRIVSRSSVKPSVTQILQGAGKRGVSGLATRAKMLLPLLIMAGGAAGLGSAAGSRLSNEAKYRLMLPQMQPYLQGQ